jgi:hypothetical protein
MRRAPWTEAEVATLCARYAKTPRAQMMAMLPGRTWSAIQLRASRLSVKAPRWWTEHEDALLREMWPETGRRTIMKKIRRTWNAIAQRAHALGLEGRWSGYVTISAAAQRTGYGPRTLLRILDAYRAHWAALPVTERCEFAAASPMKQGASHSRCPRRVVDAQAVVDAVEWWMSLERRGQAAERLGVPYTTLVAMIGRSGETIGKCDRRPPAWWDALVRTQSRRGPRVVRCVPSAQMEQQNAA